jgi:hypothetical protein
MHRRSNSPGHRWIAGIVSAILFWLVAAAGGPGAASPFAAANAAPPIPHSGGMDGSQPPSTRYLVNPNRHAVVSAAKADEGLGLGHGGGPDPAILPDATALAETAAARPFVAVARHAPRHHAASGYNARAPPALI